VNRFDSIRINCSAWCCSFGLWQKDEVER
jgi:hypothetical protein